MKSKGLSVVISAPSGAGKTTIINKMMSDTPELQFAISTTTREKRAGEVEGQSYYYIDKSSFQKLIDENEFAEWALVHGNYYGTSKKEIDRIKEAGKIPIFDVDVQGAKSFKSYLNDAIYIFIIPPTINELKNRLRGRNTDSEEDINLRLKNSLIEIQEHHNYDYVVINDVLDVAISEIKAILTSELCRHSRMEHYLEKYTEDMDDNSIK